MAAAVGLTWWAANSLGYQFGYSDYSNPYYTEGMPAYYSEPIITPPIEVTMESAPVAPAANHPPPVHVTVESGPATAPTQGVSSEAMREFDQARADFMEGKYVDALKLTENAIARMPHDAVLHEFRSLVLFALQRYTEAAATIHPVLDVGPGWDWKTLSGLYPSIEVYKQQLRALEAERTKNPKAADLRFLLGYHYLSCGFSDEALTEFRHALEARPNDGVSAALVATLSPRGAQTEQPASEQTPAAIPSESIVGTWHASGKNRSKYSMTLNKDGSFTWAFTKGGRKQEVKGVHTMEGNVLAMEPSTGGVMLAELTPKGADALQFKMIGGASKDAGLEFRREGSNPGR